MAIELVEPYIGIFKKLPGWFWCSGEAVLPWSELLLGVLEDVAEQLVFRISIP